MWKIHNFKSVLIHTLQIFKLVKPCILVVIKMCCITYRQQSVDVTLLLLAISPHPGHGLVIVGRIPVRVEHDQPIGSDQIQATPTRLAAQHEDKLWALWKIENLISFS